MINKKSLIRDTSEQLQQLQDLKERFTFNKIWRKAIISVKLSFRALCDSKSAIYLVYQHFDIIWRQFIELKISWKPNGWLFCMRLWGTSDHQSYFFSGSHWELICHTQGLHITNTPLKIAAGTHFHGAQHGTKHGVFTCWWRISLLVAITKFSLLYQATHYNQKTPISASSRWQVRSAIAKKGSPSTLHYITTNHQ